MGRTASTEPQCLYKGALYLYILSINKQLISFKYYFVVMSRLCQEEG